MEIQDIKDGDIEVVYPIDRIDTVTAKDFEKFMNEAVDGNSKVVVSFSKINYISSAGLRVFLVSAKKMKAKQGQLILCDLAPKIFEVFKMSGFDKILTIASDLGQAKQQIN